MLEKLTTRLFKEKVNGETVLVGGLEAHKEDVRDFQYGALGGWFDYKPKHRVN